jgi:hypothetical protein
VTALTTAPAAAEERQARRVLAEVISRDYDQHRTSIVLRDDPAEMLRWLARLSTALTGLLGSIE